MLGNLVVLTTMVIVGVALFGGGKHVPLPPLDNRAAVRAIVFVMSIVPQLKLGVATKESSMPMAWRSPANA